MNKEHTIEVHLTADEIQLIIDALVSGIVDLRWSSASRASMGKLKEELEHDPAL